MRCTLKADPFEIIEAVENYCQNVDEKQKYHVYVGVTSQDNEFRRFAAHARLHGQIKPKVIKQFDDRFKAFSAEGMAIEHLRQNRMGWGGLINKGEGWEMEALCGTGNVQKIYMFHISTPFSKLNNEANGTGILKRAAEPQKKSETEYWCRHCQQNFKDYYSLSSHMAHHTRRNVKGRYCQRFLTDNADREIHSSRDASSKAPHRRVDFRKRNDEISK